MSKRKRSSQRIASLEEQKTMGGLPSKQLRMTPVAESVEQPGARVGNQERAKPGVTLNDTPDTHNFSNNIQGRKIPPDLKPKREESASNWSPTTPDSAKAGLQLPSVDKDANKHYPESASETFTSSSPRLPRSSLDREPRSGGQNSSTEAGGCSQHPNTKKQVFRRAIVEEKEVYKITCPELVRRIFLPADSSSALPDSGDVYDKLHALIYSPMEADIASGDLLQHARWLEGLLNFDTREPKLEICLQCLYPPASTVFKVDEGGLRAYQVGYVESTADATNVHAYYLGFDAEGQSLVPLMEILKIPKHMAARTINTLGVLPEWYVRKTQQTQTQKTIDKLVDRGTKFWDFKGRPVHREHVGDAWPLTGKIHTRVVVDYTTSSKYRESTYIDQSASRVCPRCLYDVLGFPSPPPDGVKYLSPHDPDICSNVQVSDPSPSVDVENKDSCADSKDRERAALLMYCPSMVGAFSLMHNSWKTVPVDSLQPVTYRAKLQEQLQVEDDRQWTALNTAVEFFRHDDPSKGLRIFLRGNTGVGKTFTVECLAEKHRRPLYILPCSSLGSKPDVLDTRLREAYQRARDWHAILFLDNVDYFLRNPDVPTPEHIALLSIFRRALERAASGGVLVFLAASSSLPRDNDFDSRVDLSLVLPNLSLASQKFIWTNAIEALGLGEKRTIVLCDFIKSTKEDGLEKQDVAFTELNGWVIHACVRAAMAIARRENGEVCLSKADILGVLNLGKAFEESRNRDEQKRDDQTRERVATILDRQQPKQ